LLSCTSLIAYYLLVLNYFFNFRTANTAPPTTSTAPTIVNTKAVVLEKEPVTVHSGPSGYTIAPVVTPSPSRASAS
jgi:hypothetical protein